jgi:hypothetical protein
MDVDRLYERTRAHIVQESFPGAHAYECQVRKSACANLIREDEVADHQQCPGPELPTWRILMVHPCSVSECGLLHLVRWRISCNLILSGKVAGQAPDFLVPVSVIKDKVPVVVFRLAISSTSDNM